MARACFVLLWIHGISEAVSYPKCAPSRSHFPSSNRGLSKFRVGIETGMDPRRYRSHGGFFYSDHSVTEANSFGSLRSLLLHSLLYSSVSSVSIGFLSPDQSKSGYSWWEHTTTPQLAGKVALMQTSLLLNCGN